MRKAILILTALTMLAAAASARANWGPHGECWQGGDELHHCYAFDRWSEVPGQQLRGSVGYFDTQNAYGESCYGFVSNNMWLVFSGRENYIETGQNNECTEPQVIHPYYASTKEGHQYAYIAPWTVPMNRYNGYWIYHATPANGPWGIYWEGAAVKYDWGYPAYATNSVEDGIEIDSNVEPHASGRSAVAGVWTDGSWHNWPAGYTQHVHNGGLCIGVNPEAWAWGNVAWSTCHSGTRPLAEVGGPEEEGRLAAIFSAGEKLEPIPQEVPPSIEPPATGKEKSAKSLEKKAAKYAAKQGEGQVIASEVTTQARSMRRLDHTGEAVPALARKGETVRSVTLEGTFTSRFSPPSPPAPKGKLMVVTLNTVTGRVVSQYIGDELEGA